MTVAVDAEAVQETLDWEIVSEDWWKTSFKAISWSYKTKPGYPRPPHYHNLLVRGRRRRIATDAPTVEEDVDLNDGLSGVRAAEEALKRYEVEVSILSPDDLLEHDTLEGRCVALLAKEDWDEKVRELLGGILEVGPLPEVDAPSSDVPLWDLNRLEEDSSPPGSPSTTGCTDSETSGDSDPPPSTPRPTKTSYARVVSSETATSPTVLSPLPSKLLSAAALTFIPSTPNGPHIREPVTPPLTSASNSSGDSPFSSPTYNFHFPSLTSTSPADRRESRSLPPSLQKDESGFYVEVAEDASSGITQSLNGTRSTTPRRPSAAFLPAFLTDGSPSPRPRNSKTREIVDRLRSSGSSGSNRKAKKSERTRRQPSESAAKDDEMSTHSQSDSKTSSPGAKSEDATDGWISGVVSEEPSPRCTVTDDGWITQGNTPSEQQQQKQPSEARKPKHTHGHKRSSGSISVAHSSTSSASSFAPGSHASNHTVPHTPARPAAQLPGMHPMYPGPGGIPYGAPYGAPYANANPAAYMPMQYPMQPRGPQWPMGYQAGMYPVYQPFGVMPRAPYGMVPVAPLPQPSVFFDGKGKPGGAIV
ncbi:hypothetical protein BV20DRAFT_1115156 [Pilatotrama ljubarskyi]|nr:hypothetical protein BV20DRAFT_1115156 [Pilatotrama ljubarskyi]